MDPLADAAAALPIGALIPQLREALASRDTLILEAPPGAGKTTIVPLALLDAGWLRGRRIVMLQPRRVAARSAALRMASLLGEAVGETVGYRVRLESRVGPATRIEVVTEGLLIRMLRDDPALEQVGLLIFDEFHERSLDADLGLALALYSRATFNEGETLRILVMSATLATAPLQRYLGCECLSSEGRGYPVEVHYGSARKPRERIVDRVLAQLQTAVERHPGGSILVFLPGRGEIERVKASFQPPDRTRVLPLYGDLDLREQQRVLAPCPPGERRVVLATNVAETSLTIEGVDVVIDSGLERRAAYDPASGMNRLQTVQVSRASAEQRAGRAGRLGPGVCYRLWSEAQHRALAPDRPPEIERADLTALVLQLYAWGIHRSGELPWLTEPPAGAFAQGLELLRGLGALHGKTGRHRISPHGEAMANLATHPRLAHMLLLGAASGLRNEACLLAAVLSDRDPLLDESDDMRLRLDYLGSGERVPPPLRGWCRRTQALARQLEGQLPGRLSSRLQRPAAEDAPGYLLACAYPDRLARRRHGGAYQLANGRSAQLPDGSTLARERWLVVAEAGGRAGGSSDRIRTAAPLNVALLGGALADLTEEHTLLAWDRREGRFVAERQRRVGALVLQRQPVNPVPDNVRFRGLLELIRTDDLGNLAWSAEAERFRARAGRMVSLEPGWPRFDRAGLVAELESWLGPYLVSITRLPELAKVDLAAALRSRLTHAQQAQLDRSLPEHVTVPSGARVRIDYTRDPPVLAVKLQEMFGSRETPRLADGRVPLVIHLLSPAGRPLQVTQDLASFWSNGYSDVRREMRGRYPRHPWPEDPLTATPTGRTKGHETR